MEDYQDAMAYALSHLDDTRQVTSEITKNFSVLGKFDVYFFDGPHHERDQYDGIATALPALERHFVLIVDDWNWPGPGAARRARSGHSICRSFAGSKSARRWMVRIPRCNGRTAIGTTDISSRRSSSPGRPDDPPDRPASESRVHGFPKKYAARRHLGERRMRLSPNRADPRVADDGALPGA
jgi:hypothetical protein